MKRLLLFAALIGCPAGAQAQPASTGATARADVCAPIGKTARGELVYAMKCDRLPAAPPPQAEAREPAPPPEPEARKGGLFGWSFDRRNE